ncbi:MAG: hypothetical protein ACRC5C_14650 [Bacilli bacterium]
MGKMSHDEYKQKNLEWHKKNLDKKIFKHEIERIEIDKKHSTLLSLYFLIIGAYLTWELSHMDIGAKFAFIIVFSFLYLGLFFRSFKRAIYAKRMADKLKKEFAYKFEEGDDY